MSAPRTGPASGAPAAPEAPETRDTRRETGILHPGAKLGRYVVIGEIGAGGVGVVYAASDPELGRRVAVKLLRAPVRGERLVREARALAKLAHPNVVAVYDVGAVGERTFVAMELVPGVTLRRWLDDEPRSWREALDVLAHAGRGLAAAHAKGIVHRDVKPDNIVVDDDGRVRVLDFGLVSDGGERAPDDATLDESPGRLTETGALVGTPMYMAPEQFRAEEADARTDQWSYAATTWEAVYGERPFRGATMRELSAAVTGGALPEPPRARGVPSWLRRALARGLSVDRDARHASMDALLAVFEAGLAREEALARRVGRRYERLAQPAAGTVAGGERVLDRLTGAVVTLVRVPRPEGEGERSARLALAFRRLAGLRHPNLVSVLDFGFDHDGAPYFVLDHRDPPGESASAQSSAGQVRLERLVELLRALAYLHRRGVAHGAIAPGAVLLAGGRLRLVPLGAEVAPPAGLAYTAPEVAAGGAASPAADLYAFGVLAYELLAFRHPFGGAPRAGEAPDLAAIEVEPAASPVIGRLLEADPGARYASAEEALAALAEATSRPLPADTVETRESFLKTAPLVGRDAEAGRLEEALREAEQGRGSAFLLGGESGAGKSRLLEELRVLAIAAGALVLRGQEEREGGSPYRLFRGALRKLTLLSDLDDLEAGVLLPIVPDLPALLGRPVTPAPELDAPSAHARVRDVVERVLRREDRPVVLLLEDLQWSRSDSLELLRGLLPCAPAMPLLVAATHRSDERPRLREELRGMIPIDLGRLPEGAIADLSAAMIGQKGRRPSLVGLLRKETEGNAFFLVEAVRALAEEAGGLDAVGAGPLPERVLSGGIRRVVERRLRRVPEDAQALLRTAAVIGRTLDPKLCAALAPEADVDAWVDRCVEACVLERTGDVVRFSHDKLREGLLAEMGDEEQRRLHRRVAEAILEVHAGAHDRYAALAHHFGQAGDATEEARYAALAGEQAVRGGAIPEGMKLLERALELDAPARGSSLQRAHRLRLLGDAEFYRGDLDAANRHLSEAMRILGHAPPRSTIGWIVLIVSQLLVQIALRLASGRAPRRRIEASLLEASKAAGRMATIGSFMLDAPRAFGLSLLGVNLAERGGGADIFAMGVLGLAAGTLGLRRTALGYFERGRVLALEENRPSDFVHVVYIWAMLHAGHGELDESVALIREARGAALRIGDGLYTAMTEGGLGEIEGLRGHLEARYDHWNTAQGRLDSSYGDHRVNYVVTMADALALLGRFDEAERALGTASAISPAGRLVQSELHAVRARIHACRGELDRARAEADACVRTFRTGTAVHALCYLIFEGVAEAIFASWQSAVEERRGEAEALAKSGRRLLREAEAWARIYPIGRPLMLVIRGRVLGLSGAARSARRAWLEAVREARARGTPLYEAMACFELAHASPASSEERREHLARAREIWSAAGAAYHLRRLAELSPQEG